MIAFGPVPSRRLGRSLGINNIPPKICTYSCAYCQVGRTNKMSTKCTPFYNSEDIFADVQEVVINARKKNETIDYITFVSDGEPTLDINLGTSIDLLKFLGFKIAVITNASLIWNEDVKYNLQKADLLSFKIDTVDEKIWQKINRPHKSLQLSAILKELLAFSKSYSIPFFTETMLINGINTQTEHLRQLSVFISQLKPEKAYLAVPIRPPAERWVEIPDETTVNNAYQIFAEKIEKVEYLIGYEGNNFSMTRNVENDLLSITAVHPMRDDALIKFLDGAKTDWNLIEKLINSKKLKEIEYNGSKFYMRSLQPGYF